MRSEEKSPARSRRVETASCDELQELRLMTTRPEGCEAVSSELAKRMEHQIDNLIDLLATEQEPLPKVLDVSIIIPCHNQENSIGELILQTQFAIERLGLTGEVVVADEGSTDDSIELAEQLGARVIKSTGRDSLMANLSATSGRIVLLGDAGSLERWFPKVPTA